RWQQLAHAKSHARRPWVLGQEALRQGGRQGLDQVVSPLAADLDDAAGELSVVDRVGDVVAPAGGAPIAPHFPLPLAAVPDGLLRGGNAVVTVELDSLEHDPVGHLARSPRGAGSGSTLPGGSPAGLPRPREVRSGV